MVGVSSWWVEDKTLIGAGCWLVHSLGDLSPFLTWPLTDIVPKIAHYEMNYNAGILS